MNKQKLFKKQFYFIKECIFKISKLNNVFYQYILELNNCNRIIIEEDRREDYFNLIIYNSNQIKIFELIEGNVIINDNLIFIDNLITRYGEINFKIKDKGMITDNIFKLTIEIFADFIRSNYLLLK